MYMTSVKSADKLIHNENCRFAKMIAAHNVASYNTADEAYASGRCACRYCADVLKKVPSELSDLQNICEANDISILFDQTDGTLDITTPYSEWKLRAVENSDLLYLYHKNTLDFDDGSSPYAGYHFQGKQYRTILWHLKYIISHDWYWGQQFRKVKKYKSRRKLHNKPDMRTAKRINHIVKMHRAEIRYLAEERYAAGM